MSALSKLLLFVLGAAILGFSDDPQLSKGQLNLVLSAVTDAITNVYYDKKVADERWPLIQRRYLAQIEAVRDKQDALALIREMLSELHNSHILFYSPEEWQTRQKVLPFSFEKTDGRVFVTQASATSNLHFGDEVLLIDGRPSATLRPRSLAHLDNVYDNPLYGQRESAELTILRDGKRLITTVTRVPYDRDDLSLDKVGLGTVRLYMRKLPAANASSQFHLLWTRATAYNAIVLDLRDCHGGWPEATEYLLTSLLGPAHKSFSEIDRSGKQLPPAQASGVAPAFKGVLVVLQSSETQSECEMLSASLKEAGRATVVGERSAGALNGYTEAISSLPDSFVRFAVPYTRSVSPAGREYEGVGIKPDVAVRNTPCDFTQHRDVVLDNALRLIQSADASRRQGRTDNSRPQ